MTDNVLQKSLTKVVELPTKVLPFVGSSNNHSAEDEYRWEELQKIEKRRRAILQWVEEPFWKIITHWNGTVLRFLAMDPLLWLTMMIYAAVRVVSRLDFPEFLDDLGSGNITVIGGFLSFFLGTCWRMPVLP